MKEEAKILEWEEFIDRRFCGIGPAFVWDWARAEAEEEVKRINEDEEADL